MTRQQDQAAASGAPLRAFAAALESFGFEGDFEGGLGARTVASTDNSIYEILPAAIVYPRSSADINKIVRAARAPGAEEASLTARGGNTGTNGQSLNSGVVVDFARHMNRILEVDVEQGTVLVEPGVVLAQLNAELDQHGLFFPPTVSTATRATIGGMVATDASGKGSRIYGKTSDYIEGIDVVLSDGSDLRCEPTTRAGAASLAAGSGIVADIHREALRVVTDKAEAIAEVFPDMNRGLTGYNLQKTYDAKRDVFNLAYLLAGSEGTLALTKTVRLRVQKKPGFRALAVIRYADFAVALADVQRLLGADPLAIEFLDDKVLGAATTDILWSQIESVLGPSADRQVKALNFIEFAGFSENEIRAGLRRLGALADPAPEAVIDVTRVDDQLTIERLWMLREKAVGLLAKSGGKRQGVAFVEDTAVPPHQLSSYVADFRQLLDSHGLQYGMFGHADVGCLHVRPFLDLKDSSQAALIRPLSDEVAALTKRYGGLLWGEHGRGFRGEYSPIFFGDELYPELVRIKAAFDPHDRLNPGKLASPSGLRGIERIDAVPLRAGQDRLIGEELQREFDRAVACNGNGACFSWDSRDAMCPSYKATRDRAQSPKGRAALLRAWSRAQSSAGATTAAKSLELEEATFQSLATCLSCKACTTSCPVNVDIPAMKSRFLGRYYARRRRPVRHHLLAQAERLFAFGRRFPAVANLLLGAPITRSILREHAGLVDFPSFSSRKALRRIPTADERRIRTLTAAERQRTVILVEDSFTSSFDAQVPLAARDVLEHLDYRVYRLPARPNGKILHLLGLRNAFAAIAKRRVEEWRELAAAGVRLIGLDAATALLFEQEYREVVPSPGAIVGGLEHLLAEDLGDGRTTFNAPASDDRTYFLFGHCTESALRPNALGQWQQVLRQFGVNARPVRTGCCGMAGMFGHETANLAMSKQLFELSWREPVEESQGLMLATGFSCREQSLRFSDVRPRHPVELIAERLRCQALP